MNAKQLRQTSTLVLLSSTLALATFACSKDRHDEGSGQATTTGASATNGGDVQLTVFSVIGVDIDTKLAVMCGLPQSSVYFTFDSAKLSSQAKERLDKIASCARDGAAKGKDLLIVGRTDPSGPDEYNQKLGMGRADAVAGYLRDHGVAQTRLETLSKGEPEPALSGGAAAWPRERRVTVRLEPSGGTQ